MSKNKIEHRTASEVRAGVAFEVCGRALTYNKLSSDLGGFRELHLPGVFTRSLASGAADVKALVNHDANLILGRQANGTLTLTDSFEGLDFVCKLNPASQQHRDLYQNVKSGLMNQCSFAFAVDPDGGDSFSGPDGNGLLTRTVKRAKLFDVSVVTAPAFPGDATSVAARSAVAQHSVVSDQTAIRAQIAAWEARRKQRIADARSQFADYSPLSAEEIVHIKKMGYSSDVTNELRLAAVTREIAARAGYTGADFSGGFACNSPRDANNPGAVGDPTQSLRDDDFDWDDDDSWTQDEHERAASFHRNLAAQQASMSGVRDHHQAADLHVKACTGDLSDSHAARAASKALLKG
jgi:uncharacterized protein